MTEDRRVIWRMGEGPQPFARVVSVLSSPSPDPSGKRRPASRSLVLEAFDGCDAMGVAKWVVMGPPAVPKRWMGVVGRLLGDYSRLVSPREDLGLCREELLRLLRATAVRRGEFTFTAGGRGTILIDIKRAALSGRGHRLLGMLLWDEVERLGSVDCVAGAALGGCSLASSVSLVAPRPLDVLYVRSRAKGHGTGQQVEGDIPRSGSPVVLLEDVVRTGSSVLAAASALQNAGLRLVGVLVVVDRQEGGLGRIAEALSILPRSLFTMRDLVSPEEA